MDKKTYFFISGVVFTLVAIAHLLRIITQCPLIFGTWAAPMMASWIGLIIGGILSFSAFRFMRKE